MQISSFRKAHIRRFIFNNYWWLAISVVGIAIYLVIYLKPETQLGYIGSILVTALAFCYFVQQQRLSETQLFKQLFTEFNERYKSMGPTLTEIDHQNSCLSEEQALCVVEYFNLCAEEYLFYCEGYIHQQVWIAWCRGMLFHINKPAIRKLWNLEEEKNSYYGLSYTTIQEGTDM